MLSKSKKLRPEDSQERYQLLTLGVRETKSAAAAELMQKLVSKVEAPLKVDFARYKKKDIADGVTQASELLRLNIYALRRLEHEQSLKNDKGT